MKTYVLGFILLGITNLNFAQNELAYVAVNNMDMLENSRVEATMLNTNFVEAFKLSKVPQRAQNFQKYVASYDISETSVYATKENMTYTVVFKEGDNTITNVYDQGGVILASDQSFTNIRLPYDIMANLAKSHPGWAFDKIQCDIKYVPNKTPLITYKVVLRQDDKRKMIKLSA